MKDSPGYCSWDSGFFGLKTGKILAEDSTEVRQKLEIAVKEEYELVYAYTKFPLCQNILDEFGGADVGGQIIFSKSLDKITATQAIGQRIYQYHALEPNQSVLELILLSGRLSRFATDPRLPQGSYRRMYEKWIRNTLEARDTSAVLVSGDPADATGLITASWHDDHCSIGLLAVSEASQGQGIGSSLLRAVEHESVRRGAAKVTVKTQAVNYRARSLYERNGYRVDQADYLYHFCPKR